MEQRLWNKCINCWEWISESAKGNVCPKCGGKIVKVCTTCGKFSYDCKCISKPV